MMLRPLLLALFTAVPLAGPAHAVAFSRVDGDNDGLVSYSEAQRRLNRISRVHFDKCDTDGDGVVAPAEFGCLAGIYDALYREPNS